MSGESELSATHPTTRASWILLTMGDRPAELAAAVESIPGARSDREVIVVLNGAPEAIVPDDVRSVPLRENVGIPAGRNAGANSAQGEVLFFLDDDAVVATPELMALATTRFDSESDLAVIGFRIVDPETGETARRHVPRLGSSDPGRSGDVTSFLGGACAIRARAFSEVGGLPDSFFYALEETDLAWRLLDAGWRVAYDAAMVVHHPRTEIARHGFSARLTARNRVLLARRRLPLLLAPIYVAIWAVLTLVRTRSWRDLWAGTREGLKADVERQPMSWTTVWRLTKLGRPPLV